MFDSLTTAQVAHIECSIENILEIESTVCLRSSLKCRKKAISTFIPQQQ